MNTLFKEWNWIAPADAREIRVVDMHTGGEPLRIPISGLPDIPGVTVLEKRRYFRDNLDHIRKQIILEPRGHADMYGAILSEPTSSDADFDVFFIHNDGYSTMCGHAIIALVKFAFETRLIEKHHSGQVIINTPAGKVKAQATFQNNKVIRASFENVPSFVLIENKKIIVEDLGEIRFDVAFGGAFYALVDTENLNMSLDVGNAPQIIERGRRIKNKIQSEFPIVHPIEDDLSFLYGTIFYGKSKLAENHSRNVCVFADGELDRSPTGTGVSARAALHYFNGQLKKNEEVTIESIIGSTMTVEVIEQLELEQYHAVIPKVSGTAHFTGINTFYFEESDCLKDGFFIR